MQIADWCGLIAKMLREDRRVDGGLWRDGGCSRYASEHTAQH
jgi:hypothetical protein